MNNSYEDWILLKAREIARNKEKSNCWFEEQRHFWTDSARRALIHILNGGSILLATDNKREWFRHYAISNVYNYASHKPLLPIINLNDIVMSDFLTNKERCDSAYDMLKMVHNNFIIWYVGENSELLEKFYKKDNFSLIWLIGNSGDSSIFNIPSADKLIDYKLIEMFHIFIESIYAAIFEEFKID